MKFISVEKSLPIADWYEEPGNPYYLVKVKQHRPMLAMYMMKDGEEGWYKDYTSKLIIEVTHWMDLENE